MEKSLSLVVPCYNEEQVLPIFIDTLLPIVKGLDRPYEILFVDDGSRDNTLNLIKEFASQDPHIKYLSFSRNFGKEAAIYAGLSNVKNDYVAVMDADLQDPPAILPDMIAILDQGEVDSVATRRVDREGEPPIRSIFARWFYKLINQISDADIVDGARDYRLMKRKMVDAICQMPEYNRFSKGIYGWVGFKTHWYPYQNTERAAGETKWSFWKLLKYAIDGIEDFSSTPLYLSSWLGIFCTVISFMCLVIIAARKLLFGDPVAGWASTVCIILFIGGLQMLCMGIMGQYLAKTYLETKKRPHYIIRDHNVEDCKDIL